MIILLDGREGVDGRALLLISALHHCVEALQGWQLRFSDASTAPVRLAVGLLAWDLGLKASVVEDAELAHVLADAQLYASLCFAAASWPRLAQIREAGIPTLVARQFPSDASVTAESIALIRAAHDPSLFADHLVRRIRSFS